MGVRWRQECMGVHGYEWVRLSVRGWVHVGVCVWEEFSEYLLETANYNMHPLRIFYCIFQMKS